MVKERTSKPFQAYDPWESFSPRGRGITEKSIVDTDWNLRLDEAAWELGKRAYDMLSQQMGRAPSNDDLIKLHDEVAEVGKRFRKEIPGLEKICVVRIEDGSNFIDNYDNADVVWRAMVAVKFFDIVNLDFEPFDRRALLCICCLLRLDDVVIANFMDGRGLTDALSEAISCMMLLDQRELVTKAIKSHNTAKGKEGAKKRHKPSTELKQLALKLYKEKQWPSARQAAKAIYPQLAQVGEKKGFRFSADRGVQTVYEWLLKDKKTIRKRADV